jgi:hypothetical protein
VEQTETLNANGKSMRPDVSVSAPVTPWKSCGRMKLIGMKAVAWSSEPIRKKRVVRFENMRYLH